MPELRQNTATKEWVIIASERAQRPEDFQRAKSAPPVTTRNHCPFCSGAEEHTPPEIMSYRAFGTQPNTPGWTIRVVPNKFSALVPEGIPDRLKTDDFFISMAGFGQHEVLIESPNHDQTIATMEQKQVEEIFSAYRERCLVLNKDVRFEKVIIFKNYGEGAGTSLRHPHSQIVALPVVPLHIRNRLEEAMRYFDDRGRCVYCDMISKEKKAQDRLVLESDNFVVLEPFASRSPFETWVLPKEHGAVFANVSELRCQELAFIMRQILIKIYQALGDPDYNYMFYSAPSRDQNLEYYHWHIKILPRVTSVAGFELGSGVYINTVLPEQAARFLRDAPLG